MANITSQLLIVLKLWHLYVDLLTDVRDYLRHHVHLDIMIVYANLVAQACPHLLAHILTTYYQQCTVWLVPRHVPQLFGTSLHSVIISTSHKRCS